MGGVEPGRRRRGHVGLVGVGAAVRGSADRAPSVYDRLVGAWLVQFVADACAGSAHGVQLMVHQI